MIAAASTGRELALSCTFPPKGEHAPSVPPPSPARLEARHLA